MNHSDITERFKVLLWIEQDNHFLVATSKDGKKHLPEIEPEFAETTLEAIERFGRDVLEETLERIDLVEIVEQTTHENFSQNDTLFIYKARLLENSIMPKLSHSQIFFWVPMEKANSILSSRFLEKIKNDN